MFRFVLLIVLLTGSPVHAKIRPADLLRPADYNAVLISPTGEYLAVVKSVDEDTWFTIYEMPARKATFNSNMGKKITIANIDWVSDDYLVVAPARKAFRDVKGLTGELFSINAKKGSTPYRVRMRKSSSQVHLTNSAKLISSISAGTPFEESPDPR